MKFKKSLCALLICIGVSYILFGQKDAGSQKEALNMMALIEKYHVSPPKIDDILSEHIFQNLIYQLDPNRIYFTSEDFSKLAKYEHGIDEELKGNSWSFLKETNTIYRKCLKRADSTINGMLSVPMTFSQPETLKVDTTQKLRFFEKDKEYPNYLGKWLKLQVLREMYRPNYMTDSASLKNPIRYTSEQEARKKVLKRQQREIKQKLEYPGGTEAYISALYLNSIALCMDPHTEYMTEQDKQLFNAAISSENLSFGMQVDENNYGDLEIKKLVPGGPAWKSNELNEGDIILKVCWLGEKEQDLYGMDLYEADEILRQPDKKQMSVTVKKKDGSIKTVTLVKAKLTDEENVVKGYVLNNSNEKVGYISLPAFYTSSENQSEVGCANDVAKEIIKLLKDNIQGLILDLRFNGGGSLNEAIDLAGIFIDFGPILMTRDQTGKLNVMKDMSRGSIYNGPLVVLVNGQSASASEVVAAALQDYNRAVIVGNTTFGKASSQVILPNDSAAVFKNQSLNPKQKYGFLKLTINRLYRISGKSIQQKGVVPDIYIPDIYNTVSEREASYDFALSPDSLVKPSLFKPLALLPISDLREKSMSRQASDKQFIELNKDIIDWKDYYQGQQSMILLDTTKYQQTMTHAANLYYAIESLMSKATVQFEVGNSKFDDSLINFEPETRKVYEDYYEQIANDLYIQEAFNILSDFSTITKTK